METRIAKLVSVIGHPLLTISLSLIILVFVGQGSAQGAARLLLYLIIGAVILPIIIWTVIRRKKGAYSDLDVSDRIQRKSLFVFIMALMLFVSFVLFWKYGGSDIFLAVLFASILILIAQLINYYIKISLHVSMNVYLAFLMVSVNVWIGIFLLGFSILIGWSRIVLVRHTIKEVLLGAFFGFLIGGLFLFATTNS